jgi:hypothetical protein
MVSKKLLVLSVIFIIKISLSMQISDFKQKLNLDCFLAKIITLGLKFNVAGTIQ